MPSAQRGLRWRKGCWLLFSVSSPQADPVAPEVPVAVEGRRADGVRALGVWPALSWLFFGEKCCSLLRHRPQGPASTTSCVSKPLCEGSPSSPCISLLLPPPHPPHPPPQTAWPPPSAGGPFGVGSLCRCCLLTYPSWGLLGPTGPMVVGECSVLPLGQPPSLLLSQRWLRCDYSTRGRGACQSFRFVLLKPFTG